MEETSKKLKEIAEKITELTGFGGKLHVNDIQPEIREAYALGWNDLADQIEHGSEFVKEDVADGNDGYWKVRAEDLKHSF